MSTNATPANVGSNDGLGVMVPERDTVPPAWNKGHDARGPKPHDRPLMQWHSDSTEPDITSGTAIWRYVTPTEPGKEVVSRIRFDTFAAAHEAYTLMLVAWCAGREYGRSEIEKRISAELRRRDV